MTKDNVNHPAHYTEGRAFEVIEVLEDWCERAPSVVKGALQWQVLKYLGRVWDKTDPLEDLKKSRWYLNRLITELEADQAVYDTLDKSEEPVLDYDEIVEFHLDNVPFDATGNIDLWDDSLGPQEPVDGAGNPVYAGDYKGPLYAPHPQVKETAHVQYVGDAEWDSASYQGPRDEDHFEEDEIIRIFERRGTIIGVKKDGSSCILGSDGTCQ